MARLKSDGTPGDGNGELLQLSDVRVYQDEAVTPLVSPQTGITLTLKVPDKALLLNVKCTAIWRHGTGTNAGSTAGNGYVIEAADGWVALEVAGLRGTDLLLQTHAGGSATWYFYFPCVK